MQIKSILLAIATLAIIALFALFYFGIPITLSSSFPFIVPIVGGLLVGICTFLLGLQFASKKAEGVTVMLAIAIGIVAIFIFYSRGVSNKKEELKTYGIIMGAQITEGRTKTRKYKGSTTTTREVGYKYKHNGNIYYGTTSVSDFDTTFKDVDIPIVYSSRYPQVSEALKDANTIFEYTNREELTILTEQMVTDILHIAKTDSISSYLRNCSPLWVKIQDKKIKQWMYHGTENTYLDIVEDKLVFFTGNKTYFHTVMTNLVENSFVKTEISNDLENEEQEEQEDVESTNLYKTMLGNTKEEYYILQKENKIVLVSIVPSKQESTASRPFIIVGAKEYSMLFMGYGEDEVDIEIVGME